MHEARGLDVLPNTIDLFRRNGDEATAGLLDGTIYPEEVRLTACHSSFEFEFEFVSQP